MAYGSVEIKSRPLRLAFLIRPNNKKDLLKAIRINSSIWGGTYNPLIPNYQKLPVSLKDGVSKSPTAKEFVNGYIEHFDPDYIVTINNCSTEGIHKSNRKIIQDSEILKELITNGTPKYAIGLYEILHNLINEELKYVRRTPLDIRFPTFNRDNELFLSSVYGLPEDAILRRLKQGGWRSTLKAKFPKLKFENYTDFFRKTIYPRKLVSHKIKVQNQDNMYDNSVIYLLDSNNIQDIIDYWNLRATGRSVLPIPIKLIEYDNVLKEARSFIDKHFYTFKNYSGQDLSHHVTVQLGRSIDKIVSDKFIDKLALPKSNNTEESKIVLKTWYPRMWSEWARSHDHGELGEVLYKDKIVEFNTKEERITISSLAPEWMNKNNLSLFPRIANEVKYKIYSKDELYGEVVPECSSNVMRALDFVGSDNWRFSKQRMIYYPKWWKDKLLLNIPLGKDIFTDWLEYNGWENVKLSPPGKIAEQTYKQLGGDWRISLLSIKGIIELISEMSGGRSMNHHDLFGKLSKIANKSKFGKNPSGLLKSLVSTGIIELGIQVQCDVCTKSSWYALSQFDYKLKCPICLSYFDIPSHNPKDLLKWSYTTKGPFNQPNQADGIYTVLLTYRFFSEVLNGETTPIMSFIGEKGGQLLEADLGLLFRSYKRLKDEVMDKVFVECKTFYNFEKKDIDRMQFIINEFPGSTIVFATLKNELSANEMDLIKSFVLKNRRHKKYGEPINSIMILTSAELLNERGHSYIWEDAGEKYEKYRNIYLDFDNICDITQQVYLGIESWHEWQEKKIKSKNKLLFAKRNK